MDAMEANVLEGLCLEVLDHISSSLPALMDEAGAYSLDFTSNIFHSPQGYAKLEVNLFSGGKFVDRVMAWGEVHDDGLGNLQIRLHLEAGEWGADLANCLNDEFWCQIHFHGK